MKRWISLALLSAAAACANLVGITDTEVSSAAAGAGGSGAAGTTGTAGAAAASGAGGMSSGGSAASGGNAGSAAAGSGGSSAGTTGTAGQSSGGDSGCNCTPDTPTCEGGACIVRGPTMVQADTFYIDSTEVTVAQYQEFLDAPKDDLLPPSECDWNDSYEPAMGETVSGQNYPMTWVDWCDAYMYCQWADKHLCGKIGGGALPTTDALDISQSQWYRGCGGPNEASHPVIGGVTAPDCNDDGGGVEPAGSTCEGSYPGLYDMQGNANEWIDSCGTGIDPANPEDDDCLLLGGSYTGVTGGFCSETTDATDGATRNARAAPWGFRCCNE